jgi:hypothetical protein
MIADGINAANIPKDMLWQLACGVQNLGLDGKGVGTMVVKDVCRLPEASPDHLVQNKLDEQMPLDDQPELICVMAKPEDVMKHDVLV